jgi:hypothetical protein
MNEVIDAEIEVVNEMKVKIISGNEKWFNELVKRITLLVITKNTKEEN